MAGGGTAERAPARDRAAEDLADRDARPPTVYLLRRHEALAQRCFWTGRPPISTRAASLEVWVQTRALVGRARASATIPLVIFMSDHGEMLGDHGLTAKGCRFYERSGARAAGHLRAGALPVGGWWPTAWWS